MPVEFSLARMIVLVVDDTAMMRANHKKILTNIGFNEGNIFFAQDGAAALATLAGTIKIRGKVDLIVCDWDMPKVSGLEVLQMVKKVSLTKGIPFLMVTGHSKKEDILLAMKTGANSYMVKPFREEEYFEKVVDLLAQEFVR
ncbi:MAG: response regulator [Pseudomonadota bacterium]